MNEQMEDPFLQPRTPQATADLYRLSSEIINLLSGEDATKALEALAITGSYVLTRHELSAKQKDTFDGFNDLATLYFALHLKSREVQGDGGNAIPFRGNIVDVD